MQQFQCHFAVDGVVFCQQQSRASVVAPQLRFGVLCVHSLRGGHDAAAALQASRKPEAAARPRRAVSADFSAHQLRQPPRDGQAKPGAAVLARDRGVGLFERLEQPGHLLGRDANAAVRNLEAHQQFTTAVFQKLRTQGDGTLLGEFDGIAGVVEQRLAQSRRVALQPHGNGIAVNFDLESLVSRRLADDRDDIVENRGEVEVGALQMQPARLDLGQVENVVDDRQQVLPGAVDLVQARGLFRRRPGAPQQMGEADDGVQRSSDLVAHVGQEAALGQIGGLRLLSCRNKFRRTLLDQLFQMMPMSIQFHAKTLLLGDVFLHRHVVTDRSVGLAQRRDDGGLDVFAAVLAHVVELALPWPALAQRLPHRDVCLPGRIPRVQHARIPADNLLAGVSRRPDESFIDVLDLGVEIGDHDALRALLHG